MELTAPKNRENIVHLVQSLEEWNEVQKFRIVGVVKPRCDRNLDKERGNRGRGGGGGRGGEGRRKLKRTRKGEGLEPRLVTCSMHVHIYTNVAR